MSTAVASQQYARDLTDRIKVAAEQLFELLFQAWSDEVWKHLGYRSWSRYIAGEFDFTVRRAYQLVHQGKVTKALREASQVGTHVHGSDDIHISDREARDVDLGEGDVIEHVEGQVAEGVEPREAVRTAVAQARQPVRSVAFDDGSPADDVPVRAVDGCLHEWVCRLCAEALGALEDADDEAARQSGA